MLLQGQGTSVGVAAEALGRIASPAAIDALLAALGDPYPTARWHAAMAAMENLGQDAVEPLIALLENGDAYERQGAAEALGWVGSPSATPALQAALADASDTVRRQAAWALGEIGDPAARDALVTASAEDPAPAVQAAAEAALSRIEAQPATRSTSGLSAWAVALNRLEVLRWLVLALSLAGAIWLAVGNRPWALAPTTLRNANQR
jgi:HEAT repeat protein